MISKIPTSVSSALQESMRLESSSEYNILRYSLFENPFQGYCCYFFAVAAKGRYYVVELLFFESDLVKHIYDYDTAFDAMRSYKISILDNVI